MAHFNPTRLGFASPAGQVERFGVATQPWAPFEIKSVGCTPLDLFKPPRLLLHYSSLADGGALAVTRKEATLLLRRGRGRCPPFDPRPLPA